MYWCMYHVRYLVDIKILSLTALFTLGNNHVLGIPQPKTGARSITPTSGYLYYDKWDKSIILRTHTYILCVLYLVCVLQFSIVTCFYV